MENLNLFVAIFYHYRDRADCENNFDELKNQWDSLRHPDFEWLSYLINYEIHAERVGLTALLAANF